MFNKKLTIQMLYMAPNTQKFKQKHISDSSLRVLWVEVNLNQKRFRMTLKRYRNN